MKKTIFKPIPKKEHSKSTVNKKITKFQEPVKVKVVESIPKVPQIIPQPKKIIISSRSLWKHLNYHSEYILRDELKKNYLKGSRMWNFNLANILIATRKVKSKLFRKIKSKLIIKFIFPGFEPHEKKQIFPFIMSISNGKKFAFMLKNNECDDLLIFYHQLKKFPKIDVLRLNILLSPSKIMRLSKVVRHSEIKKFSLSCQNEQELAKNSKLNLCMDSLHQAILTSNLEGLSLILILATQTLATKLFQGDKIHQKLKSLTIATKSKVNYAPNLFLEMVNFLKRHPNLESLNLRFEDDTIMKPDLIKSLHESIANMKDLKIFLFKSIKETNISSLYSALGNLLKMVLLDLEMYCYYYKTMENFNSLEKLVNLTEFNIKIIEFKEHATFENLTSTLSKLLNLTKVKLEYWSCEYSSIKDDNLIISFVKSIKSTFLNHLIIKAENCQITQNGYFGMFDLLSGFKNLRELYLNLVGNVSILNKHIKDSIYFFYGLQSLINLHLDLRGRRTFCFSGIITKSELQTEKEHSKYISEVDELKAEFEKNIRSIMKLKLLYLDFHPRTFFD